MCFQYVVYWFAVLGMYVCAWCVFSMLCIGFDVLGISAFSVLLLELSARSMHV